MPAIESTAKPRSKEFRANAAAMQELVRHLVRRLGEGMRLPQLCRVRCMLPAPPSGSTALRSSRALQKLVRDQRERMGGRLQL